MDTAPERHEFDCPEDIAALDDIDDLVSVEDLGTVWDDYGLWDNLGDGNRRRIPVFYD